jgi:hypothetical protein
VTVPLVFIVPLTDPRLDERLNVAVNVSPSDPSSAKEVVPDAEPVKVAVTGLLPVGV